MNEPIIILSGNLVDKPELRFTPTGQAVARFRIGNTPRYRDSQNANEWKDGESLFLTCNVWRGQAENAAATLEKGMRVNVTGRLRQRSYETKEGESRTVYEIEVDEVSPSLRNATAQVTRTRNFDQGAPEDWQSATRQRPPAPAPAGYADQNWQTAPGPEAGWAAQEGQHAMAGAPAGAPPAGGAWNGYGYGVPNQPQGQPGQPGQPPF
ncbi:single-stranded DNA-binding protein [Nonomuraea sp. NPDC049400]|uniref:single-stranded DNA-binding protein n=1 Tax=Nonomuraea sp. NPDC049400 TaxID=3364352 RepID=UPI0037AE64C9